MTAAEEALEFVKSIAAADFIPISTLTTAKQIAIKAAAEIPKGMPIWIGEKKTMMPWWWCNREQLDEIYKKAPEWKPATAWTDQYLEGVRYGMGYPGAIYEHPEKFIMDSLCIEHVLQPHGGKMIGGGWWFKAIDDPAHWWETIARPYYLELYMSDEERVRTCAKQLAQQTKSSVESGSFPFTA